MVLCVPWLVRFITLDFAEAITLFPFILLKQPSDQANKLLINHEQIHLRQQLELLVIPFYLLYFTEYLFHRMQGLGHYASYCAISFEQEAFKNEHQLNYLASRPVFAFVRYWKR